MNKGAKPRVWQWCCLQAPPYSQLDLIRDGRVGECVDMGDLARFFPTLKVHTPLPDVISRSWVPLDELALSA